MKARVPRVEESKDDILCIFGIILMFASRAFEEDRRKKAEGREEGHSIFSPAQMFHANWISAVNIPRGKTSGRKNWPSPREEASGKDILL